MTGKGEPGVGRPGRGNRKRERGASVAAGLAGLLLLLPAAVVACPSCFGETEAVTLARYLRSTVALSLLPLGVVAGVFVLGRHLAGPGRKEEQP